MKLTLKQIRKTVIIIALILLSGGVGYWLGQNKISGGHTATKVSIVNKAAPREKELDFTLFWEVWDKLEEKYLIKDDIDRQKMFYGAIKGLASSLGDPYTAFLPPAENKRTKEDLHGSFEGVGIQLGYNKEKRLAVIAPLKGMPAEAAGVEAGDLIINIKDEQKGVDQDTINITLPEAVEKIRGPKGSVVTLTLLHEGETEPYDAEIRRDTIVVPSVEVEFIDNVAHLKLMRFGELTAKQWDQSIDKISKQPGLRGVILDVRSNPGGYLKGSVNLASEFLTQGIIVKQEDYLGRVETYSVNRKGRLLTVPVVVLIDKGSASASEILAGALQDHQRAKLVGTQSFGKGTIQESEELGEGAGIHITTARWLTPDGHWLDGQGLEPDIVIEDDKETEEDEQLQKAIETLAL
jgi:carboxyl-terminal processing protease